MISRSEPLIEHFVSMPIVNPDTKGRSKTFRYAGIIDRLESGKLEDWKNSSNVRRYLKRLAIGFQPELYALAAEHEGHRITEIEYRLIQRPSIRFCNPAKETWAVMKEGRKTAVKVFDDKVEAEGLVKLRGGYIKHRVNGDIDRDAYEERCVDWLFAEPDRVVSHPIPLSTGALAQARYFLWNAGKKVLEARNTGRWMPSEGACYAYEQECPFLFLCEATKADVRTDWIIEEQYYQTDNPHPELGNNGKDFSLLTHSSISVLLTCELKYYWMFEKCLRKGREESEALWVGNAMHRGLEAYAKKGQQAALNAVDMWEKENPVLGEDGHRYRDQQIARARAMVRAAAMKWPM